MHSLSSAFKGKNDEFCILSRIVHNYMYHDKLSWIFFSYTAIEAPERCVFGQLINIGAVLCKSTVNQRNSYIFYQTVTHL